MEPGKGDPDPSKADAKARASGAIPEPPAAVAPAPPNDDGRPAVKFLVKTLETLLPSVVMFVLGYIFIQGVELDLKREQFTANAADRLRTYVEQLILFDSSTSPDKLTATALALGGFGGVAVFPLLSIMELGDPQRIASAKLGLEQAGRIAPDRTCQILVTVIDDPGAYNWQTRKAVSEVAGLVGCEAATGPLERARAGISGLGLTTEQQKNFADTVEEAIGRIEAAERRGTSWR